MLRQIKKHEHECVPWRGCGGKIGACIYCEPQDQKDILPGECVVCGDETTKRTYDEYHEQWVSLCNDLICNKRFYNGI